MKTEIYANLNKGGVSIRQSGKVIGVLAYAELSDVCFVVNRSGYERAIRENQRNVHAFARGTLGETSENVSEQTIAALRARYLQVKYNPFRSDKFTVNGQAIDKASKVIMVITERRNERNKLLCEMFLVEG